MLLTETMSQKYASRKNIADIFGYKDPTKLLRDFRNFADDNPSYFRPYKPYIKNQGLDTLYNIICFAFYFENKDLVDSGSRSISFKKEKKNLEEVY